MAKKREISIVERRLRSGSIFSSGSKPIPLVDPTQWTVRIVNTQISDARQWDMQAEKGWAYLERSDLAVDPQELGFRELDGRIVRWTQGHEVLMKMRISDYKAIQKMKERMNRENTFGAKANKAAILNAAQAEPGGDEGADFLNRAVRSMSITDSRGVPLED